jgi:hypothetical protein
MIWKKKTRIEVVEDKITDILHDIMTLDFTNGEIATILNSLGDQGKKVLECRKEALEAQLKETVNAINSL